jgi:hypothetical protein
LLEPGNVTIPAFPVCSKAFFPGELPKDFPRRPGDHWFPGWTETGAYREDPLFTDSRQAGWFEYRSKETFTGDGQMRFQFAAHRYGWVRMTNRMTQIVLILAFATFASHTLQAQAVAGITGTVVSGAHVTITDEATGVSTKNTTSSAGSYSTTGLLPDSYTITVEATGFRKSVQTGILVQASKTDTINTTLVAGSSTQTVQVTASAIALNTTQPQISSTVQPAIVAALPEEVSGRGRQVDTLQFLAPGVSGSTFSHRVDGGVDFEEEIVLTAFPLLSLKPRVIPSTSIRPGA